MVDDSPIVLGRLAALADELPCLQVAGLAGSGARALDCFHECRPDAVVLDIELSDISGMEVLEHIKKERPDCLVVMLTTYGSEYFRQRCMELGADFFFNKSSEFERVFEVLKEASALGTEKRDPEK
jgi:DNA-binding NarL/FixJ family response regulator